MTSRKKAWIEGLIIIGLSSIGLIESLRLIVYKDPRTLYDPLGPGWYIFVIGIGALLAGVTHIIVNLIRSPKSEAKEKIGKKMSFRLWGTVAASIFYVILIYFFGYFISTLIYFMLAFWIIGVRPWMTNIILSVIITVIYWLIFVQYSGILFPEGIF